VYCPACGSDYPPDWKVCPKDTTQLLRSRAIGKYAIEGLLGVGGMGAVYRASNPDTKARVAIKVMNPVVAGAESARARFQREAASVAALRTSHVVKVFDFGAEPDGTLYLVMELLDGHTLRDEIMPAPEYMPLPRVQMVLDGALKGLAAAHKVGIVHRDLKPENVFVAETDDGEVPKLLDFGIARVRTRDSDLTRTGSLMGTASYMAPEQVAANAGEIGPWSDVYAMGVILYEMLAGAPAFGGTTVTEVLQKVLRNEAVPLESVRPDLPQSVYTLVARCTHVEPGKRPQDAEMMRGALAMARLADPGGYVPPAHKTKQSQSVAMAATHGANLGDAGTPTRPNAPSEIGNAGTQTPVASMPPPTTGGRGEQIAPPKKRSALPFVVLGVVVAGGGGFAVYQAMSSGGDHPDPKHGSTNGSDLVVDETHKRDAGGDPHVTPPPVIDAREATSPPAIDAPIAETTDPHLNMVKIDGGTFEIGGGKAEYPLARTTVKLEPFWIDQHEMTRAEMGDKLPAEAKTSAKNDRPETPARFVTWHEARAACAALGKRLPTEAEWEVAARTTPQSASRARLYRKSGDADLYAASKDCSSAGLCDMLGSLAEWVEDGKPDDPTQKIIRGASYQVKSSDVRASIHRRTLLAADKFDDEVGFRCAAAATKGAP
jgi:serine/threonine-protein kinase